MDNTGFVALGVKVCAYLDEIGIWVGVEVGRRAPIGECLTMDKWTMNPCPLRYLVLYEGAQNYMDNQESLCQ
jgi:hypothetical protein